MKSCERELSYAMAFVRTMQVSMRLRPLSGVSLARGTGQQCLNLARTGRVRRRSDSVSYRGCTDAPGRSLACRARPWRAQVGARALRRAISMLGFCD